jgi:protein involved in polysaccharide export with SLBB domain
MSEFLSIPEDVACCSIAAAVAEGLNAQPGTAAAAKVIDRLTTSFGPVVQQIIDIIQAGAVNLPAVLQALQAAGVTLPQWATIVVTILLAIVKPAA